LDQQGRQSGEAKTKGAQRPRAATPPPVPW
jgi:hypothetical protein